MYLRCTQRQKNGKEHSYGSLVESRRRADGRVAQRHVRYLGEINDAQERAWTRSIQVFPEGDPQPQTVALFPEDRVGTALEEGSIMRLRRQELSVPRPRPWGACWRALPLWKERRLDQFWTPRLEARRKGTRWDQVLAVLAVYRLIAPGREGRRHRPWFDQSAMADLLGGDFSVADPHKLYGGHDRLPAHKVALFTHLTPRWRDLFNASFDGLRDDLTSTYFESDPPFGEGDKRKFGYRRDQRPDGVQVVIALIVTPDGFPLTYEVLCGNTSDKTTLQEFLQKIETPYGKARRIWGMDRGIPTEEVRAEMRASDPPVPYLVGTPKGGLSKREKDLSDQPWQETRPGGTVKRRAHEGERYVLARREDRGAKERSRRRRQLKWLWKRLKELQAMKPRREDLLLKRGAARPQAPSAWRLVEVEVDATQATFTYRLRKDKRRPVRRREGRYLLRSNLTETDPAVVWNYYLQRVEVEQAFRHLKGDWAIRPIFHQNQARIEAHIFVSFLAYCLHVTLGYWLRNLAPGLTTRSVLEKFATIQMVDVHIPTSDGRMLILSRCTHPEPELQLLLERLKLELPAQPPPRITVGSAPKQAAL